MRNQTTYLKAMIASNIKFNINLYIVKLWYYHKMKSFLKNNLAWIFIGIICAIPLLIWLFMSPLGNRFSSPFQTMTSLGQISALLGFSLMAINIILTARLRLFDRIFRGLNHVYIKHHLIGSVSFILLMFHPIILAIRYLAISTQAAALFLLPSLNAWPQTLGAISLLIMMVLLFFTFYLAWQYHVWKFSHRFLTLAFLIAYFHVAFISSDVSANFPLRVYLLTLSALAFIAYGYRLLVEFGQFGKFAYIVSEIKKLSQGTLELTLKAVNVPIKYFPGQFVFLSIDQENLSQEEHPFSFVSIPDDTEIKFTIKALGDHTESFSKLKTGSLIFVEGPFGTFGQKENNAHLNKKEIWIAGGIGITPFISLAHDMEKSGRQADLFLSFRSPEEAIYIEDLKNLATKNPNLNVFVHYSSTEGYLTADKVEKLSGSLMNTQIHICGPIPLMQSLRKQFIIKSVANKNIHSEEFNLK